jgi:hypothetical protein
MEPFDLAQEGLAQLKQAVIKLLRAHPEGLTNAQIASSLGYAPIKTVKVEIIFPFQFLEF